MRTHFYRPLDAFAVPEPTEAGRPHHHWGYRALVWSAFVSALLGGLLLGSLLIVAHYLR